MACGASMSTPISTNSFFATIFVFIAISFETLLGPATHHVPASYWDIVNQVNPRKGARTIRLAPRRRKTASGMRQDGATPTLRANHYHHIEPVDSLHVDEPGTAG